MQAVRLIDSGVQRVERGVQILGTDVRASSLCPTRVRRTAVRHDHLCTGGNDGGLQPREGR